MNVEAVMALIREYGELKGKQAALAGVPILAAVHGLEACLKLDEILGHLQSIQPPIPDRQQDERCPVCGNEADKPAVMAAADLDVGPQEGK